MGEVFSKTGKGQEEIKARTGNLSQRVRQVLIFIDGIAWGILHSSIVM